MELLLGHCCFLVGGGGGGGGNNGNVVEVCNNTSKRKVWILVAVLPFFFLASGMQEGRSFAEHL